MVTVAHGTTQNASRPIHSFGYQRDRALLICSLLDHTVYRPATFSPPSQMIVPLYDVKDVRVRPEFTGNSDLCLILAARSESLQARIRVSRSGRRTRAYTSYKVQGCEIVRYAKERVTRLRSERVA